MSFKTEAKNKLVAAINTLRGLCPKTVYVVCGPHLTKMEVREIKIILTVPPVDPNDAKIGIVLVERPRPGTTPCQRNLSTITFDISEAINEWEGNS